MKKSILLLVLCCFAIFASSQIRSGIVIGASDSWLGLKGIGSNYAADHGIVDGKWKHKPSFSIGYQFKFDIKKDFVLDAALLYQSRGVHVNYMESSTHTINQTKRFNAMSINMVINYKVWKGIRAGVGVEPTYYFNTKYWNNHVDNAFDYPLVAKVGYDFDFMEVSLSYKHGFTPIIKNVGQKLNGKPRDLQISVFVPLSLFKF